MAYTNIVTPYEGMIQVWHFKPGQNFQNTKVQEREKALLCSKKCWQQITDKLNKKQMIEDVKEREIAWNNFLKNTSFEMKRDWTNSIENVRRRRFENLIKQRVLKCQQQNKWLVDVLKENEQSRQQLIKKLKRKIFYENDAVKAVKSAVMLSETLYELGKQQQFEKMFTNKGKSDMNDIRQKIIENANKLKEENLINLEKKQNKQKEYKNILLKQITDNFYQKKLEAKEQLEREKFNLQNLAQELKENAEQQRQERRQKQQQLRTSILQSNQNQKQFFENKSHDVLEENKINEIILKTKQELYEMLSKHEKETCRKTMLAKEKIAKDIFAKIKNTTEEEQIRIENVLEEREEKFNKRLQADMERKQKLINERKDYWQNYIKQKEDMKNREKEKNILEMKKRLKNFEIYKEFIENQKKYRQHQINKYKQDLFNLQLEKEREKQLHEQKELISLEAQRRDFIVRDKEFFDYAENIVKNMKKKGRWTVPIERVIMEHKKKNGYEEDDNKKSRKETLPHRGESNKINPKRLD